MSMSNAIPGNQKLDWLPTSLSEKDVLQVALFLDFSCSTNVKDVRHQVGERFYDGSTFSCEDRKRVLDKLAAIQESYLPRASRFLVATL